MTGVVRSVRGLVDDLETLADGLPADPSLDELVAYVEARKDAAEALARLDPKGLSSAEKRGLGERVSAILVRDHALVMALFALREDLGARISTLPAVRRTARGYSSSRAGSRLFRRVA